MNTMFWALLLKPLALLLFLWFCLRLRYAVIAWVPESRAKRLLILPFDQLLDELTLIEACVVVIVGALLVVGTALLAVRI